MNDFDDLNLPFDPWLVDEEVVTEWEARDRFTREDHHAHVVEGWRHHWATAHIEPGRFLDLPF